MRGKRILMIVVAAVAVVTAMAWLWPSQDRWVRASEPAGTLITTGHAELAVVPDTATVVIGVSTLSSTAAAAQAATAKDMEAVYQCLVAFGIPENALQTRNFRVTAEYDYDKGQQKLRGYRASHDLYVKVDEVASLGKVLDAAVGAGATQVREVQFGVKDASGMLREALALAVRDAKEKAEALAAGAGVGPVRIKRIVDQSGRQAPLQKEMLAASRAAGGFDAGTMIAPGEVTVSASVEVEFTF